MPIAIAIRVGGDEGVVFIGIRKITDDAHFAGRCDVARNRAYVLGKAGVGGSIDEARTVVLGRRFGAFGNLDQTLACVISSVMKECRWWYTNLSTLPLTHPEKILF